MKKAQDNSNLPEEMYWKSMDKTGDKPTRRIAGSGFRYLPNCSDLKIDLGLFAQKFLEKGIIRREGTEVTIIPYRNAKFNRFARFQIQRLNRNIDNPTIF